MPPQIVQEEYPAQERMATQVFAVPVNLVTLSNAAQFPVFPRCNGRLISARYVNHTPGTGAGATCTLTPSINGVNVTGGVVTPTLAGTATRGAVSNGTAISANNTFTESDAITWTGSATTAFTAGGGWLECVWVNDDLLNALAGARGGERVPNASAA